PVPLSPALQQRIPYQCEPLPRAAHRRETGRTDRTHSSVLLAPGPRPVRLWLPCREADPVPCNAFSLSLTLPHLAPRISVRLSGSDDAHLRATLAARAEKFSAMTAGLPSQPFGTRGRQRIWTDSRPLFRAA